MSRAASHHRVNDGAKGTQGRGFFARAVRRSAVVLILAWLALAVVSNLAVPSLEQVAKEHAVSLSIQDAPAMKARNHIGAVFDEPAGDGMAMVVLDSEPVAAAAEALNRYSATRLVVEGDGLRNARVSGTFGRSCPHR